MVAELKARIVSARLSAVRSVNRDLILLYWDIGRAIVEKQETEGWGESVVERLAADLRAEFTDLRGFSGRNLRDMRRFHRAYSDPGFWPQPVAKSEPGILSTEFVLQFVAEEPFDYIWIVAIMHFKQQPGYWAARIG